MAKKRGNAEGSIYQRKDGRWTAAYYVHNKRKYLYASTREETAKLLRENQSKIDSGIYVEPSAVTINQWLIIWLREYAAPAVRPSTLAAHTNIVNNHLVPALGKLKLQQLRAEHVQAFINSQAQNKYSPATIKREIATLKVALNQAVKNQLIARSPADAVSLLKQEQKEIEFLTAEEVSVLLLSLPFSTHGRALRFILGTGLRVAELCGLRWCDIDKSSVHVNQITYTLRQGDEVVRISNPPKTKAGKRVIPLNDKLRAILDEQRQTQRLERIRTGSAWGGDDPGKGQQYVFATELGTPSDRHNLARTLRACLKKAGLKSRGIHALRHTFATSWVQSGADLRTLSEILGHTNVAFTMQRYVHSDTATKRKGMELMSNLI
jgi:integrase